MSNFQNTCKYMYAVPGNNHPPSRKLNSHCPLKKAFEPPSYVPITFHAVGKWTFPRITQFLVDESQCLTLFQIKYAWVNTLNFRK